MDTSCPNCNLDRSRIPGYRWWVTAGDIMVLGDRCLVTSGTTMLSTVLSSPLVPGCRGTWGVVLDSLIILWSPSLSSWSATAWAWAWAWFAHLACAGWIPVPGRRAQNQRPPGKAAKGQDQVSSKVAKKLKQDLTRILALNDETM